MLGKDLSFFVQQKKENDWVDARDFSTEEEAFNFMDVDHPAWLKRNEKEIRPMRVVKQLVIRSLLDRTDA